MPRRVSVFRPGFARPASEAYERARPRQVDKNFYAGTRWRKLRAMFLQSNPLCVWEGCNEMAEHVDHKVDRKDAPELAYEWANLQGLCQRCHNRKRVGG